MFLWTTSRTVHKNGLSILNPLPLKIFAKLSSVALFGIRDASTHEY